jgi:cytoskeleton protein RodZ
MLTVRGFVRTYAKILKTATTPPLQDLATEYEKLPTKPLDRPKLDTPFPSGRMPVLGRHHNSTQKVFGAVILVSLCLLALFVWRDEILRLIRSGEPAKADVAVDSPDSIVKPNRQPEINQDATVKSNAGAPTEEKNTRQSDVSGSDGSNQSASSTDEHRSSAPEAVVADSSNGINQQAQTKDGVDHPAEAVKNTAKDAANEVAKPSATKPEVTISPKNALVLEFKQNSWVQIKRANGTVLLEHLYAAGSQETVDVSEPLSMIVGNAPGVKATLRGQGLILPLQTGSNVANLNVK